jgi:hypothetical protein
MAGVPTNHVVALVGGASTASSIASEMRDRGLESPTIVCGEKLSDRLNAESGLVARGLQKLFGPMSEQSNYLRQYEEAVRRGQTVIAVKAEGRYAVNLARQVLDRHGASDIRLFGQLAVTDLSPDSNPSVGSDSLPSRRPTEHS